MGSTAIQEGVSRLFKYRSIDSLGLRQLIVEKKIWLSSPTNMNDPFDCWPSFRPMSSLTRKQFLDDWARNTSLPFPPSALPEVRRRLEATQPENCLEVITRETVATMGIYSMSATRENLLLWSHYADQHRGFCIEFDSEGPSRHVISDAVGVEYQSDRPVLGRFDVDRLTRLPGDVSVADKVLLTKSADWQYEREFRVIEPGSDRYLDLDEDSVAAFYVGARANDRTVEHIRDLISEGRRNIPLYRARLSDREYRLDFIAIT